jgi:hypothetical protein
MPLRAVGAYISGILVFRYKKAWLTVVPQNCAPHHVKAVKELIDTVINPDTMFARSSLELRRQRIHAVKVRSVELEAISF